MRVHVVEHEPFEGAGAVLAWATERGHRVVMSRLHAGDRLPSAAGIDLLVVMGGPQSVHTTVHESSHFDAAAEQRVILGICLGAQLIGAALGAPPEPSPQPEIGVFPVQLTEKGRRHPLLTGLDAGFDAGHWHSEMPGLTRDADILATSAGCPRQIIAYAPRVLGLQLHLELTDDLVDGLIRHSSAHLADIDDLPFVRPETLRSVPWDASHRRLFTLLDRLVAPPRNGES